MAITSKEINLSQLTKELGDKGLIADFNNPQEKLILPAEGVELTETQLEAAIEAHIAIDEIAVAEAKAQAKAALLAQLGITEEQAKLLLS
jgi:hypothetical protein